MIKNLVTPGDIRAIKQKEKSVGSISPQEMTLLREASMSESEIQIACHNLIKVLFPDEALFVQIDNGGKMGAKQKIKKKEEGTQPGFKDVIIFAWKEIVNINLVSPWESSPKQFFVEFKNIKDFYKGSIKPEQQYWHDFLKAKGESVHFCNNTVYFEREIMKEIGEFLR